MDENNRNFILAIVLSMVVLFAWQFFFVPEKPKEPVQQSQEQQQPQEQQQTGQGTTTPSAEGETPKVGSAQQAQAASAGLTRAEALAASPRVKIDTPAIRGSIALKGARLDDVILKDYHVTVKPDSPEVTLLSPAGGPDAYYAERGFVNSAGEHVALPAGDTLWTAQSQGPLTPQSPVVLTYDNGNGLKFIRTISVDDKYMFTIDDKVTNTGASAVTIYPYGLVSRHGEPKTKSYYILHEGLIGVVDDGLQEISYKKAVKNAPSTFKSKEGWLGITDKYWAAVVIPQQGKSFDAKFAGAEKNDQPHFQADYVMGPVSIKPGGIAEVKGNVFAGAKQVNLVDAYAKSYGIPKFDLLIDWGWFYFLTKPMFFALDFFYKLVGNFGIAILIVTFCIKLVLFPLANKSYVAMSKMKKLGPEMQKIKERYADDRMRQQQAMMEMYKKEKVNPASGCLPIVVQIPVFFSLYKVLFVTIEMRHAPFFGWIKDLSAPDPTSVFNLFGLIPWHPPIVLMIGAWPIIMGFTMWIQMKLNPTPPDPIQQKIFTWMPVFFTYLLASFPAGLVIYWAWNNTLSVIQQSVIMARQGVEIPLLENLGLKPKKAPEDEKAEQVAHEKQSAKASRRAARAAKQAKASKPAAGEADATRESEAKTADEAKPSESATPADGQSNEDRPA